MKKHTKIISLLLVFCMMTGVLPAAFAPANAANAAEQAALLVSYAESQKDKMAADFGFNDNWCAYFIGYCAVQCGMKNLFGVSKATSFGTPSGFAVSFLNSRKGHVYYFKETYGKDDLIKNNLKEKNANLTNLVQASRSSFAPKAGDLICFLWEDSAAQGYTWSHIGIVRSVSGGKVHYVDGNGVAKSGTSSFYKRSYVAYHSVSLSSKAITCYIRPDYSLADGSLPPSNVSVSWSNYSKQSIGTTNAVLARTLSVSNAAISSVSKVGIELYNGAGTALLAKKTETPSPLNGVINMWYDVNSELNYTLSAGTTYQYRFLATINGKAYQSPMYSFTTGGTAAALSYSFYANGGTGSMNPVSISYNGGGTLPKCTYTRSGYTFSGWNVKRNADNKWYVSGKGWYAESAIPSGYSKKVYADQCKITPDSSWTNGYSGTSTYTFYAIWAKTAAPSYTVSLNPNRGSCSVSSLSVTQGQPYGTLPTPTRTDYEFNGWYTAASGGTRITSSTIFSLSGNQTLYAQWLVNRLTISLDANGGTVSPGSIVLVRNGGTVNLPVPVRAGYTFSGWYTAPTGGTKITTINYDPATLNTTRLTYYAHWTKSGSVFPFRDVPADAWYRKDVENAYRLGLVNGTSSVTYSPMNDMTYAEAIKLAACMHLVSQGGDPSTEFEPAATWYLPYVAYARANGIPWNYANYNAKISRAEYVHIFYHALPSSSYTKRNTVTSLPDVRESDPYGAEIFTFYRAGILTGGNSRGTFYPSQPITRAEVAAILSRMMDPSARKTFTLQ